MTKGKSSAPCKVTLQNLGRFRLKRINNKGQIVGAKHSAVQPFCAAIYDAGKFEKLLKNTSVTSSAEYLNDLLLPKSGWHLTKANDINNKGQIVGYGQIEGNTRAFLLTPMTP